MTTRHLQTEVTNFTRAVHGIRFILFGDSQYSFSRVGAVEALPLAPAWANADLAVCWHGLDQGVRYQIQMSLEYVLSTDTAIPLFPCQGMAVEHSTIHQIYERGRDHPVLREQHDPRKPPADTSCASIVMSVLAELHSIDGGRQLTGRHVDQTK